MSPAVVLHRAAVWLLRGRAACAAALLGARSPARGWQAGVVESGGREASGFLGIWGGPAAGGGGSGMSWWFRCAASSLSRPALLVEQRLVGDVRSFATDAAPEAVSFGAAVREAGDSQPEKSAGAADKNKLGDRSLKLLSGSCYLPHPDKEETGGEDAHFIWDEQAIGIADGVGGWASYGIDAGQYARDIMSHAVTAIQEEPKDSIDLARVLEKAHRSTTVKGSSIACIIALTDQILNPCESFPNMIVDHPYPECTSSVLQALMLFKELHSGYRTKEIEKCIGNAATFIESRQEEDGSWLGTWGVCFTYGAFSVKALVAAGRTYENSHAIRKACHFILSKQLSTGGWGESHLSNETKVYVNIEDDRAHAVNTAWAMLTLIYSGQIERDPTPLHRVAKN